MYLSPRYLLIVFALEGDSTITSVSGLFLEFFALDFDSTAVFFSGFFLTLFALVGNSSITVVSGFIFFAIYAFPVGLYF